MKSPLILVFLCQAFLLNAQSIADFKPARYVDTIPSGISNMIKFRYTKEINNIQGPSKNKAEVKVQYKDLYDATILRFNDDHFMVDSEINDYLNSIIGRVALANGFSSKDVNAFAYRSETPNAACHSNGILSVMVGLLARLDTDDEVAFVLCHELAHHLAKDNLRGIEEAVAVLKDRDTRKSIRQAQRSTYYSFSKTSDILDELDFNFMKHSRINEFSADSAGMLLYLKAGYDPASASKLLEILGKADEDNYAPLDLEKFLVSNGIKTQPAWTQYTPPSRWHKDQKRPDSLRTHPVTIERTIAISRLLNTLGYSFDSLYAPKKLRPNPYKITAQYEMVEAEFHFKNYGRALYHSIQLSKMYPDDPWLRAMTGRSLYEIYTRQKSHTLGKSVDMPDATYSESYNRLLTFIHKLRISELENVAYQYMTSQPESMYTNEHFIYSLWLVSKLGVSQMDPDKVRADYKSLYPNGTYARLMNK